MVEEIRAMGCRKGRRSQGRGKRGRQGSSGSNTRMGRGQRPNRGNPVARNGKSKKNRKGGAIGEVFGVLKDKIGVLKDKGIELLKGQLDKIGKPTGVGNQGMVGMRVVMTVLQRHLHKSLLWKTIRRIMSEDLQSVKTTMSRML